MDFKFKYSNYFLISDSVYSNSQSERHKILYSTLNGKVMFLPLSDVSVIEKRIIPNNLELTNQLIANDILVPKERNELDYIVKRNQDAIYSKKDLAFVILPTSFCNMGCAYCGQTHRKGTIKQGLEKIIVSRIASAIEASPDAKRLGIAWFGGEPLVAYSKIIELSAQLIELAEKNNLSYQSRMASNGSLLTCEKLIELSKVARIKEYSITFDGPAVIHDKRRILLNGKKNFERTIQLLAQALNDPNLEDVHYILRTNIDKGNQPYIEEYLDYMKQKGFDHPNITFHLLPVYSWSNDVSQVKIERQAYAEKEIGWLIQMLELGLRFPLLNTKPVKILCSALDYKTEVITAEGKLYSCSEHPLVDKYEDDTIGYVTDNRGGFRNKGHYDDFNNQILEGKQPCSSCVFLGVCGGVCPKQWVENNIPCPSFKINIQQRFDIHAVSNGFYIL